MLIVDLVSRTETKRSTAAQACAHAASEGRRQISAAKHCSVRILIKTGRGILFVDVSEIIAFEARFNHVVLQLKIGSHLFRSSLSQIAEKLLPFGFVKIHRSFVVNPAFAEEVQALPRGDYLLRFPGGREYIVSRRYKKNLQLLAAWLGSTASEHTNSLSGAGIGD
jgi:DNA-binding LytR/AlgR family response regulator